MYTYIYIYTYISIILSLSLYIYMYTCIHIYIYTHTYTHTHTPLMLERNSWVLGFQFVDMQSKWTKWMPQFQATRCRFQGLYFGKVSRTARALDFDGCDDKARANTWRNHFSCCLKSFTNHFCSEDLRLSVVLPVIRWGLLQPFAGIASQALRRATPH